jgi:hypothetical protein
VDIPSHPAKVRNLSPFHPEIDGLRQTPKNLAACRRVQGNAPEWVLESWGDSGLVGPSSKDSFRSLQIGMFETL